MSKDMDAINVMMFGGRRAGKTSVLAAIQSCFDKVFGVTNIIITPEDAETLFTLEEKEKEIKDYYNTNERDFIADDNPTLQVNEYKFIVKLKSKPNKGMIIRFIDYSGEYLANKDKYEELLVYMRKSSIILIAIDTPYLMEERANNQEGTIGKYNEEKNYSNRIGKMLKMIEHENDEKNKMILFIPLKCEKYRDNINIVNKKIHKAYEDTINLYNGALKAEIAILPIYTMGNAEFKKFERDNEGNVIMAFNMPAKPIYFFPQNVGEPEPEFCEQPVIYILMYVLKMAELYKRDNTSLWGAIIDFICSNPTAKDFASEKELLKKKLKKDDDGYEIIYNPLNF